MRKRRSVTIGSKIIGDGFPTFIVAEAGVNHNGDIELAKKLIVEAKQAGADAVKFQGFSAHLLCDLELTETKNVEAITGGTKSSYEMYKRLELSNDDIEELKERAQKEGILFFLSVFDEERADFLNSIDIPCFKISSGDLTHLPLIKHVARSKRPIIISTGMGTLEEVKKAVYAIEKEGNRTIIILHCTADYPP
ncbi:MAG: N-acetylneuraminate synthase family protein, partial [Candidatus Omnitrophota bacterium]